MTLCLGPISRWIHRSESFRFSFVILSPQCLTEACAEGRDIYEKGGIPHAVGLLDDDVLLKEKRKEKKNQDSTEAMTYSRSVYGRFQLSF